MSDHLAELREEIGNRERAPEHYDEGVTSVLKDCADEIANLRKALTDALRQRDEAMTERNEAIMKRGQAMNEADLYKAERDTAQAQVAVMKDHVQELISCLEQRDVDRETYQAVVSARQTLSTLPTRAEQLMKVVEAAILLVGSNETTEFFAFCQLKDALIALTGAPRDGT